MRSSNSTGHISNFDKLHEFAKSVRDATARGESDGKIRGTRGSKENSVKLYERVKSGGLFNGSLIERVKNRFEGRELARKAIDSALKEATRDHRIWENPSAREALLNLTKIAKNRGHDIDATALCKNLDKIAALRQRKADGAAKSTKAQNEPGASLVAKSLASPIFRKIEEELPAAIAAGNTEKTATLARKMGDLFSQELGKLPTRDRIAFVMSDGRRFKNDIKAMLAGSPRFEKLMKELDESKAIQLDDFLSQMFSCAAPDKVGENAQTLSLNGKEYHFKKHLTDSGFGSINLYECDGRTIVLKTPLAKKGKTIEALIAEAKSEGSAHLAATDGKHGNIIGIEGALRMPDGGIAIALEFAPNGNVDEAIGKIYNAVSNNGIGTEQAKQVRLTVLKDLLESVAHLQARNISHVDLKGGNLFIDAQGNIKLGDFGTSKLQDRQFRENHSIDNPLWADALMNKYYAPIIEKRREIAKAARKHRGDLEKQIHELRASLKSSSLDAPKRMELEAREKKLIAEHGKIDRIAEARIRREAKGFDMSGFAADKWSIGIVAYQLFANKLPFDSSFMSEVLDQQSQFLLMSDKDRRAKLFDGIADAVIPPEIKEMIFELLSPNEADRPAPSVLLKSEIFQTPAIGSKQTRDLLVKCVT